MIELMNKKKILLMIQYGSYNYNLSDLNSDIDWRGFSNSIEENKVENFGLDNNDICINNTKYLYKAISEMIPKFTELLFSDNIIISDNLSNKNRQLINELFILKNDIIVMDLRQMYKSYLSEFYMHQKWIIENRKLKNNYKYLIHSFRILDILIRFANVEFIDYKHAIYYSDTDINRNLILDFKSNKITFNNFQIIINNKLDEVLNLKSKYNQKVNLDLIEYLQNIVNEISQKDVI